MLSFIDSQSRRAPDAWCTRHARLLDTLSRYYFGCKILERRVKATTLTAGARPIIVVPHLSASLPFIVGQTKSV
jgi:hypothetical protein